ncbi:MULTISPECIES: hypothetical protein [unclassified Empedobacter]|uniref:hypothetical protein n=1 Tax=unclassified Empedobacter TaxID=2643773 RepID=UPI0025B9E80C|nr:MULTISPECIES: hypothetical protein [unclassified Empedobacter]
MKFEKELLKFIYKKQQDSPSLITTLEELSKELNTSKSDIDKTLRSFTQRKYCISRFEEGEGTVIILPVLPAGLKLIQ